MLYVSQVVKSNGGALLSGNECSSFVTWVDDTASTIIEALTDFQHRFYGRLPQLHPVLDRFATYELKLYDHYEAYVAGAMIMSTCGFIEVSCLEVRALLTKQVSIKRDAKLWPYYVRTLSGGCCALYRLQGLH